MSGTQFDIIVEGKRDDNKENGISTRMGTSARKEGSVSEGETSVTREGKPRRRGDFRERGGLR